MFSKRFVSIALRPAAVARTRQARAMPAFGDQHAAVLGVAATRVPCRWRLILPLAGLLLFFSNTLWADSKLRSLQDAHGSMVDPATSAQLFQVQAMAIPEMLEVDGEIQALRHAALATEVMATVKQVAVQVGDRVRAGQALLHLDDASASQSSQAAAAQLKQAGAELALAQAELQRQQSLYEQQYISKSAWQQARTRVQTAQARMQSLRAQAKVADTHGDRFVLRAPFDGIVGRMDVSPGDVVLPGHAIATVFDPDRMRIEARVPQRLAARLGDRASLVSVPERAALPGIATNESPATRPGLPDLPVGLPLQLLPERAALPGINRNESPAVGPDLPDLPGGLPLQLLPERDIAALAATIRLALPAAVSGIAPGMPARLQIPLSGRQELRLQVPRSAIVRRGDHSAVYVRSSNGEARLRLVRTGRLSASGIEILSGLQAGEFIYAQAGSIWQEP